jgi:peroxiredoxin
MQISIRNLAVPLMLLSLAVHEVFAQAPATEASITKQLQGLRAVPDAQRPAATEKIALDIRTLPAGLPKLKLANGLSSLATEGDPGKQALNAVAETLAEALKENPIAPKTPDAPPASPYMELAKLIRYEHVAATLDDPQMARAETILEADDADIAKADFTLKDLKGKKVTLSELKGKIVLVNFWATWCPPCRKEMPDLDAIYTHFQPQGLVILSLTDEDMFKVGTFINGMGYHPPVLLDTGGKVAKEFHVDGIPKSFVFDRDGKLVAQSIDMRTQHQFLTMLAQAGLHP